MSLADAFLDGIRKEPYDDAPRLIFADWLEEHDDPRGQFLRLQCQRAREPNPDRALALLAQEEQLLQRHGDEWLGPLRERGILYEFYRGMLRLRVEAWRFIEIDWSVLVRTPTWEWVELVAIRQVEIDALHGLVRSPLLSHMKALDLSWNSLGDNGVARIASSAYVQQLNYLDLSFNGIGPEGAARIALSPQLDLLRVLTMDDNHLGGAGAAVLANTRLRSDLQTLQLRWNDIGPDGAAALAAATRLPRLATLSLGNNRVGDLGASRLAAQTGLPHLNRLYLEHNGIGAAGAAALRRRYGDRVHL